MKILARTFRITLLSIIVLTPLLSAGPKSVSLRLNLPQGFRAVVVETTESNSITTFSSSSGPEKGQGEQKIQGRQTLTNEYLVECLGIDANGIMTIRQTLTNTRGFIKNGEMITQYDSADPNSQTVGAGETLTAPVGKPVTFKVTSQGKVLEVEGFEPILEKIGKILKTKYSLPDFGQKEMDMWLQRFKNERPHAIPAYYPTGRIVVGDSWVTPSFCLDGPCPTLEVASNTWTAKDINASTIHMEIVYTYSDDSIPQLQSLEREIRKSQIRANNVSQMYINIDTGLITSWDLSGGSSSMMTTAPEEPNGTETRTFTQSAQNSMKLRTEFKTK
ncbi:MAG: DUF6263 family protein [Planctomycetota bacterium]